MLAFSAVDFMNFNRELMFCYVCVRMLMFCNVCVCMLMFCYVYQWEQRVAKSQEGFEEISKTIRKELAHFERQKVRDFKATIVNYLQTMMNNQQQVSLYCTGWRKKIGTILNASLKM